jgi:Family of unknown function (DUF6263)
MKKYCIFFILVYFLSCKTQPGSDRDYDKFDPAKTYKLQLNPAAGSAYYYDIANESETELEVDDKKTGSLTKTDVGITYKVNKDTVGNFLLTIVYDKVHLYSKNGDIETEADAANATGSLNPVERMLGFLKSANINATISPSGEIKNISGYKEMGDKIIAGFAPDDISGKAMAQSQWEKRIGNGLVKNNIEQLFKIFPDSVVHIKDSWKLTYRQEEEISLVIKSTYTLKAINSDIAVIGVEGTITSDQATTNVIGIGVGGVTTDLKGEQEGEFEMETKTGMLISCKIKAKVKGTIQVMGREVPVEINTSVKMNGHKL